MISIFRTKKHLLLILIFAILITSTSIKAQSKTTNIVNIYFFHSHNCSHCKEENKYLDIIEKQNSNVNIYRYEISEQKNNQLRLEVQDLYKLKTNGVPLTIIGNTPYVGYKSDKSKLIFNKTIAYYSKYGYKDQVGELLNIETISQTPESENAPSLENFIKTYGNYQLIGNLYTDQLDSISNALILGILSQINLIHLIFILIINLTLRLKNTKQSLNLIVSYLLISIILNSSYVISNQIYNTIITLILLTTFIINLIKFYKTKENNHLYTNIIIIISIISNILENHYYLTYSKIFNNIIKLHNIVGLNKISHYGNYFFIILTINILFIIILYKLNTKTKNIN